MAQRLGTQRARIRDAGSAIPLGDDLVGDWLPAREAALAPTTHAGYLASVQNYLIPHIGTLQLRQLRADHLTSLYRPIYLELPVRKD